MPQRARWWFAALFGTLALGALWVWMGCDDMKHVAPVLFFASLALSLVFGVAWAVGHRKEATTNREAAIAASARADERAKLRVTERARLESERLRVRATMELVHLWMERGQRLLDTASPAGERPNSENIRPLFFAWWQRSVEWGRGADEELGRNVRVQQFIVPLGDGGDSQVFLAVTRKVAALRDAWDDLRAEHDRLGYDIAALDRHLAEPP